MEIIYFDVSHATRAHDYIIETTGGLAGFKSPGNLDSLLYFISHDLYYPTFEEKVSHLFFGLTKFHIFNDGNKRTALFITLLFLKRNGIILSANPDFVGMTVEAAAGQLTLEQIVARLRG